MNNPNVDSGARSMAIRNYQAAWNIFCKVHQSGTPNFHKKNYRDSYQNPCSYAKNKSVNMFTGSVLFIDQNHIHLPKIGNVRVSGSKYQEILQNGDHIHIGTTTILFNETREYFVPCQLGAEKPFVTPLSTPMFKLVLI